MSFALRANAIWKSYAAGVAGCSARVWVLRGANLVVERGECVAILGARGAGTTTLLHCLAGLRRTDAGRIECALPTVLLSKLADTPHAARDDVRSLLLCEDDAVEPGDAPTHWLTRAGGARGATTIVATHDLARVRHVIDRALLLRDGRLAPLDRTAGLRRVAERFALPPRPRAARNAESPEASDPPPSEGTPSPAASRRAGVAR